MPIVSQQRVAGPAPPRAPLRPVPSAPATAACAGCPLWQLCAPCGSAASPPPEASPVPYGRRRLAAGDVLHHEGDAFHSIHAVRSGSLKSTLVLPDGREQVVGFALPGDLLALDAIANSRHISTVTAIEDTQLCAVGYGSILAAIQGQPAMQRSLSRELGLGIVRSSRLMFLLGRLDAQERMAAFLLDLSHRFRARGLSACELSLRMSRAEIGSYLGLTLETISRTLSLFRRQGLVTVDRRRIGIVDLESFAARFPAGLQG